MKKKEKDLIMDLVSMIIFAFGFISVAPSAISAHSTVAIIGLAVLFLGFIYQVGLILYRIERK